MRGMNSAKRDSSTASPNIPGKAIKSAAKAQFASGVCRHLKMRRHTTVVKTDVSTKLTQYRCGVDSNTCGPRYSYRMVPAIQNTTPSSRNSTLSNGLIVAPSFDWMVRPSGGEAPQFDRGAASWTFRRAALRRPISPRRFLYRPVHYICTTWYIQETN